MPVYEIAGIPVDFPFEPYDVQKAYMEKLILCLRDSSNGVLESPTGTGKTLSLLCASLAWVKSHKEKMQSQMIKKPLPQHVMDKLPAEVANKIGKINSGWSAPKIIYASRTHSQLTQAMQELKRSAYGNMRAVVLGSRDQLCIHPDVMREQGNSNKIQLCKLRVDTKTCSFQLRVESRKDHPDFRGPTVMDIEDLVKVGQKLKMCPYFGSKELVADADITFMPYNYLLDPKARKANKIELSNTIVILDEAHNIEKICEESASVQIKSSDIAVAIDDVTHIMHKFVEENKDLATADEPQDFTLEDLALLKEMLLDLEKCIDEIVIVDKQQGVTHPAAFMFELLEKANFTYSTSASVSTVLEKLVQYLAVESQHTTFRKGTTFQTLADLLTIVFVNKEDMAAKVFKSFKVHVEIEEVKQQNSRHGAQKDGWLSKGNAVNNAKAGKIVNYWCFNPGFGMEQLLNTQTRSIILTSGTLAPLKPLIAELAIPVAQFLENPHIVDNSQVYVKIIGSGPDREQLISNYANRDNPKYISSLGSTILNVSRIVPDGLLVFFPSYPMLNQCVNAWQASGLWSDISRHKPIFVEPRNKEAFTNTMEEFYKSINDSKGACFLAVCRGKVSEGLDFADRNGRAVIITGLPFPPLKDPKVILKKRYLEENRTKENELLSGQAWYSLEATRAVNQAIGRVIRHRHDYGAILLCDARFQQPTQVQQLSKWLRGHLGPTPKSTTFGPLVRELRDFFRNAEKTMPKPKQRSVTALVQSTCEEAGIVRSKYFADSKEFSQTKPKFQTAQQMSIKVEKTNSFDSWTPDDYKMAAGQPTLKQVPSAKDFMSRLDSNVSAIDFNHSSSSSNDLVKIHKRERCSPPTQLDCSASSSSSCNANSSKKKRYKLIDNSAYSSLQSTSTSVDLTNEFSFTQKPQLPSTSSTQQAPEERVEFLKILRSTLTPENFSAFTAALISYKRDDTFEALMDLLLDILGRPQLHYMLRGMRRFLKAEHKMRFDERLACLL